MLTHGYPLSEMKKASVSLDSPRARRASETAPTKSSTDMGERCLEAGAPAKIVGACDEDLASSQLEITAALKVTQDLVDR